MTAFRIFLSASGLASASIGDGPAKLVARRAMTCSGCPNFSEWGYGQSILIDAMLMATERLDGMEGENDVLAGWVNPVLDGFLNTEGEVAYNLSHGLDIVAGIGPNIGDKVGLPPHAYLHRALHYNGTSDEPPAGYHGVATDLQVARRTVDEYVLTWPLRWTDGTVSRDLARKMPDWDDTGEHQYIWGDDAYMGLTLPARMIVAGLDTPDYKYAKFIAEQHPLFVSNLRDPRDDLYFHGYNAKLGTPSCCKWGRANGWALMTHVEVLQGLLASGWEGASAAAEEVLLLLQKHAQGLAKLQAESGRWHQLVDNSSQFEETSCTAMFALSMAMGVDAGWLRGDEFAPVIGKAFQGLLEQVDEKGSVHGVCNGWGIHPTADSYNHCATNYSGSAAGGLGNVLKALVVAADWEVEAVVM